MELRQLEYLDAVVRHGGFVRAAQEVYVTQSALSQQITRLESELGLALLRRGPKGVEPTPAGVEFLTHARAILAEVIQARASVTDHLDGTRGVVRVAATVYDSPGLPEALVDFHRHHPQVQLALHHGAAAQVVEQVASGTADIAVLAVAEGAVRLPAQIAVRTLAAQRLWLVSAVEDPLARADRSGAGAAGADPGQADRAGAGAAGAGPAGADPGQADRAGAGLPLGLEQLRGRPVIMPERGTALRELLTRAFTDAGFSPLPLFETSDPETIRQLVAAGLGLSVVPSGWLRGDGPAVATLPVALPAYRITMLAGTEPRVPARDLLVDHLAQVLTGDAEG